MWRASGELHQLVPAADDRLDVDQRTRRIHVRGVDFARKRSTNDIGSRSNRMPSVLADQDRLRNRV